MSTKLNVYLHFRDETREAMHFYKSVFGGVLELSTFGDFGMPVDADEEHKVMHAMLETDNGMEFMASDTPNNMQYNPISGVSLALFGSLDDELELRDFWRKLSKDGKIVQPLELAPWGDHYGELVDKFGVSWLFDFGNPSED